MENKEFKITVKHWDEEISVSRDHSDIDYGIFLEMIDSISKALFSESIINKHL